MTIPDHKAEATLEICNFFHIFLIESTFHLETECSSLWEGVRPPKNSTANHKKRYSWFSAAVGSKSTNCYINTWLPPVLSHSAILRKMTCCLSDFGVGKLSKMNVILLTVWRTMEIGNHTWRNSTLYYVSYIAQKFSRIALRDQSTILYLSKPLANGWFLCVVNNMLQTAWLST